MYDLKNNSFVSASSLIDAIVRSKISTLSLVLAIYVERYLLATPQELLLSDLALLHLAGIEVEDDLNIHRRHRHLVRYELDEPLELDIRMQVKGRVPKGFPRLAEANFTLNCFDLLSCAPR